MENLPVIPTQTTPTNDPPVKSPNVTRSGNYSPTPMSENMGYGSVYTPTGTTFESNIDLSKYQKFADVKLSGDDTLDEMLLNDLRAMDQSLASRAFNGITKAVVGTAANVLGSALMPAVVLGVGVNELSGLIIGDKLSEDLTFYNNSIMNGLTGINEGLESALPNYKTTKRLNAQSVGEMIDADFFFETIPNALAFVGAAAITRGASATLAARAASKVAMRGAKRLATQSSTGVLAESSRKVAALMSKQNSIKNIATQIGNVATTASWESALQAQSFYKQGLAKYTEKLKSQDKQATPEELAQVKADLRSVASGIYAVNLALVGVSYNMLFRGLGKGSPIRGSRRILGMPTTRVAEGVVSRTRLGKALYYSRLASKPLVEGGEEFTQSFLNNLGIDYVSDVWDKNKRASLAGLVQFTFSQGKDTLVKSIKDPNTQLETIVGALIGGGVSIFTNNGQDLDRVQRAVSVAPDVNSVIRSRIRAIMSGNAAQSSTGASLSGAHANAMLAHFEAENESGLLQSNNQADTYVRTIMDMSDEEVVTLQLDDADTLRSDDPNVIREQLIAEYGALKATYRDVRSQVNDMLGNEGSNLKDAILANRFQAAIVRQNLEKYDSEIVGPLMAISDPVVLRQAISSIPGSSMELYSNIIRAQILEDEFNSVFLATDERSFDELIEEMSARNLSNDSYEQTVSKWASDRGIDRGVLDGFDFSNVSPEAVADEAIPDVEELVPPPMTKEQAQLEGKATTGQTTQVLVEPLSDDQILEDQATGVPSGDTIAVEQVRAYLSRFFPQDVMSQINIEQVDVAETINEVAEELGPNIGAAVIGTTLYFNQELLTQETLDEEIFHLARNMALGSTASVRMNEAARRVYPAPSPSNRQDIRKIYEPLGYTLTDEEVDEIYYEEAMASDYVRFITGVNVGSTTNALSRFFAQIREFFQSMYQAIVNPDGALLRDYFKQISNVRFEYYRPMDGHFRNRVALFSAFSNSVRRVTSPALFTNIAVHFLNQGQLAPSYAQIRAYLDSIQYEQALENFASQDPLNKAQVDELNASIRNEALVPSLVRQMIARLMSAGTIPLEPSKTMLRLDTFVAQSLPAASIDPNAITQVVGVLSSSLPSNVDQLAKLSSISTEIQKATVAKILQAQNAIQVDPSTKQIVYQSNQGPIVLDNQAKAIGDQYIGVKGNRTALRSIGEFGQKLIHALATSDGSDVAGIATRFNMAQKKVRQLHNQLTSKLSTIKLPKGTVFLSNVNVPNVVSKYASFADIVGVAPNGDVFLIDVRTSKDPYDNVRPYAKVQGLIVKSLQDVGLNVKTSYILGLQYSPGADPNSFKVLPLRPLIENIDVTPYVSIQEALNNLDASVVLAASNSVRQVLQKAEVSKVAPQFMKAIKASDSLQDLGLFIDMLLRMASPASKVSSALNQIGANFSSNPTLVGAIDALSSTGDVLKSVSIFLETPDAIPNLIVLMRQLKDAAIKDKSGTFSADIIRYATWAENTLNEFNQRLNNALLVAQDATETVLSMAVDRQAFQANLLAEGQRIQALFDADPSESNELALSAFTQATGWDGSQVRLDLAVRNALRGGATSSVNMMEFLTINPAQSPNILSSLLSTHVRQVLDAAYQSLFNISMRLNGMVESWAKSKGSTNPSTLYRPMLKTLRIVDYQGASVDVHAFMHPFNFSSYNESFSTINPSATDQEIAKWYQDNAQPLPDEPITHQGVTLIPSMNMVRRRIVDKYGTQAWDDIVEQNTILTQDGRVVYTGVLAIPNESYRVTMPTLPESDLKVFTELFTLLDESIDLNTKIRPRHEYFILPFIRETSTVSALEQSRTFKSILYDIKDQVIRTNEDMQEENFDAIINGSRIPIRYRNMSRPISSTVASSNALAAVMAFAMEARQFSQKNALVAAYTMATINAQDSGYTQRQMSSTVETNVYNVRRKARTTRVGNIEVDLDKVARMIVGNISKLAMSLNLDVGITGMVTGQYYNFLSSIGSQSVTREGNRKAGFQVAANAKTILMDQLYRSSPQSRLGKIIALYDIQGIGRAGTSFRNLGRSTLSKLAELNVINLPSRFSEPLNAAHNLLAVLASKQVPTVEGGTISLLDAIQVNEQGELMLAPNVEQGVQLLDVGVQAIARNQYRSFFGAYDTDSIEYQRHTLGVILGVFKKYLPNGIKTRFAAEQIDYEGHTISVGFYRATIKALLTDFDTFKKALKGDTSVPYHKRAAISRALVEWGTVFALSVSALALGKLKDELTDDERRIVAAVLYYNMRFLNEIESYAAFGNINRGVVLPSVGVAVDNFFNPGAAINKVTSMIETIKILGLDAFGIATTGEYMKMKTDKGLLERGDSETLYRLLKEFGLTTKVDSDFDKKVELLERYQK